MEDKALRFDAGKITHELIPGHAMNELAKVYEMGSRKYAPNNWRKGMKWSRVLGSLKRHLNYFERGIDHDDESKLLHMAHVVWNAVTLLEYYKIYPQGDDRPHDYLNTTKIGLDVDQVICDFNGPWSKLWGHDLPECWFFDGNIKEKFDKMKEESKLDEFYSNLPPIVSPKEIPFEPHCYITSRPVDSYVTIEWLRKHKFPIRPVYTVEPGVSKATVIKEAGCDVFVDDRWDNFVELTKEGVCCYLLDAPWNHRYNCGYKRIKSLKELI